MHGHYAKLGLNLAISVVIMYLVMFSMINSLDDFHNNLNTFYMALMMVAPMAMLMLLLMRSMYANGRLNLFLHAAFAIVFVGAFLLIRSQGAIGDRQFLRSMIPHHSGAILMCREASLTDPQIVDLCRRIAESQRREIDEMNAILARM